MSQTVTAYQKFIRQSPRKMRMVADLVRGLPLTQAIHQLTLANQKASTAIKKVVLQAKANAINNAELVENSLKVQKIIIEEGPTYKRWNPVSRGRAHPILKRTSHIKVIVSGNTQPTKN